jgi:hypothetical protein
MDFNNNTHFIKFDESSKVISWHPPAGFYNSIFKSSGKDSQGRDVIRFQITSLEDPIYDFWARHQFRDEDRSKLNGFILNWLGEEKYLAIKVGGGLNLEKLYGTEADIELKLIPNKKGGVALRVIENVAPHGSLLPIPQLMGEFEI